MRRPLFVLDYEDSPFEHGWQQYDPRNHHNEYLVISKDPRTQKPMLVKTGGFSAAVGYPGLGNWLKFYEPMYVVTARLESSFHIYFNVQTTSGKSAYIVYGTAGWTGLNGYGEYQLVLEEQKLHDGSWHSLIFDIAEDTEACFGAEFLHLSRFKNSGGA